MLRDAVFAAPPGDTVIALPGSPGNTGIPTRDVSVVLDESVVLPDIASIFPLELPLKLGLPIPDLVSKVFNSDHSRTLYL